MPPIDTAPWCCLVTIYLSLGSALARVVYLDHLVVRLRVNLVKPRAPRSVCTARLFAVSREHSIHPVLACNTRRCRGRTGEQQPPVAGARQARGQGERRRARQGGETGVGRGTRRQGALRLAGQAHETRHSNRLRRYLSFARKQDERSRSNRFVYAQARRSPYSRSSS